MAGRAYIGTSGWAYPAWKDTFYKGIPQKDWLHHCSRIFTGIEVNATFYGLQKRATFEKWRAQTVPGFKFAIKGNRFLTHRKKLAAPGESIRRECERAAGLGDKLAAVLWQLPPALAKDMDSLNTFAQALEEWPEPRHSIEFRHPSWFTTEVAALLSSHRIAVCLSDAADWPMWDIVATDMVYVRLHGHTQTYASSYSDAELRQWADRTMVWLKEKRDVHVYFDNDAEGAAPYNAMQLIKSLHL